jgi:hypothetical protein
MQASEILNWLSIVESAVKIIAIIFAGGWAVFILFVLQKVATSRAQLEKIQSERDKTEKEVQKIQRQIQEIDLNLKVQPIIRCKIRSNIKQIPSQDGWLLFANLEIDNIGNAPAKLDYKKGDPFLVTLVSFDSEGKHQFGHQRTFRVPQAHDPNLSALSTIIRGGGQESIPFVVHLDRTGLYLLSFRALLSSADRSSLGGLSIPEWHPISWTAKQYVWVV